MLLGSRAEAAAPPKDTPGWNTVREARAAFTRYRADSTVLLAQQVLRTAEARRDPELDLTARMLLGASLSALGHAREAEAPLRTVLARARAKRDSLYERQSLRYLGYSLGMMSRTTETVVIYRRLLDLSVAARDTLNEASARLGLAYQDLLQGRYSAGRAGYERAIPLLHDREPGLERGAIVGLCRCLEGEEKFDECRACYRRLDSLCVVAGDDINRGDALNNLGTIEHVTGDLAAAARYYRESMEVRSRVGDLGGVVTPATNLALIQVELGQYRDAARVLEAPLENSRQAGYRMGEARVLNRLAEVRAAEGRYAEASELIRQGLALADSLPAQERANLILTLGHTLARMDSAAAAVDLLSRAASRLGGDETPYVAGALELELADALAAAGRHAEALEAARRARGYAARARSLDLEFRSRAREGVALLRMGLPRGARPVLEEAAALWEANRVRQTQPEYREVLSAAARLCVSGLLELQMAEAGVSEDERCARVFATLQRFKVRTLRERIGGPWAVSPADAPVAPVSLADLQGSVLRDGELLLEAFVGHGLSIVVAVTPRTRRLVRLHEEPDLPARLQRFRSLAAAPRSGSASDAEIAYVNEAGRRLGAALLEPVRDLVEASERLVIAPDEELGLIPWAALAAPGHGVAEPLAARREVVLVPSAGVLADLRRRSARAGSREPGAVLALAGRARATHGALPGAAREVRELGRRYDGVDVRAGGRLADPAVLGGYEVLHLATHTSLDDQHPWRSGIDLGYERAGGDGYLRAAEIAALPLKARLAVLSSCESAGGPVSAGEGVLGLTSAFVSAGVPATVATLWPVSDRVTEALMAAFYHHLADGRTVAAALRAAQLEIRARPATAHPFYWAGFVVLGDGDVRVALHRRADWTPWGIGSGIFLLVMALVGLRQRRPSHPMTDRDGGTLSS